MTISDLKRILNKYTNDDTEVFIAVNDHAHIINAYNIGTDDEYEQDALCLTADISNEVYFSFEDYMEPNNDN